MTNCNAEELRLLMEWAAFLLIVVMFAAAGAWRWARATKGEDHA